MSTAETHPISPSAPFECPYCRHELEVPEDLWFFTCVYCREKLDLKAQFAFQRGLEAFDEGQELMIEKGPRKQRSKNREHEVYKRVLDLFTEAYSALQVAFLGRLENVQRQVGVEMMASMTAEFFLQTMISPLEVNYWNLILREQNTQVEIDRIKQRLNRSNDPAGPSALGPLGALRPFLTRVHGIIRMRQLKGKLPEMAQKIKLIEDQIDFVDIPHARNKSWKP